MPNTDTSTSWKEFAEYFYLDVSKIPQDKSLSNYYADADEKILEVILKNHALNIDERTQTRIILAERYWGSANLDFVPTDSNRTEAFRDPKKTIRIKYAFQQKGIPEILKNKSFFNWLNDKEMLWATVIRDVGSFYVAMIEGEPLDKLLKEKDLDKRTSSLDALFDFISKYHFGDVILNPIPGQAQYSVELYKVALLRLANKLPEKEKEECERDITEAAGNIISMLSENTPVSYTSPDSKLSNYIVVQGKVLMSDRGWNEQVFEKANNREKNFDKYLGLPFMDLGCLYASFSLDPALKEILPEVKTRLDELIVQQSYWSPELARAAFKFGQLYVILSQELKYSNAKNQRKLLVNEIEKSSPTP